MPNRIIKESICSSEDIAKLDPMEEIFFYRLIVNCDDFGRCDARPQMLKAKLFPINETIGTEDCSMYLIKLVEVGLVAMYENDGRPYLFLTKWEDHQQMRARRSKYPDPPTHNSKLISIDINGNQLKSDEITCTRESNPIQSESNPNLNPNPIQEDVPYQKMIDLFHERCPSLPKIKSMTDKRRRTLKARWADLKGDVIDYQAFLDRVEKSDFLTNRTGTWKADFDWIMTQHNFVKIIEGNYDNRPGKSQSAKKNGFHNFNAERDPTDLDAVLRNKGRGKVSQL